MTSRLDDLLEGIDEAGGTTAVPGEPKKKKKQLDLEAQQEKAAQTELDKFLDRVNVIRNSIAVIKKNIDRLGEIQNANLSALSDEQEKETHDEIDKLIDETNKLASSSRDKLKEMEVENRKIVKERPSESITRIRITQHSAITKKLVEVMTEYQNTQIKYKNKFKQKVQRQFLIVKPDASKDEVESVTSGNSANIFSQQLLSSSHQDARKALENIQERHQDIIRIEQGILELHQLFLDLSVLIETQGDLVNMIEHNVNQAVAYTGEGVNEMAKAIKLQKKTRRKQCCLFACLVIVLIIVIILSTTFSKSK